MVRPVMSAALRECLGDKGSSALTDYVGMHGDLWKADVMKAMVTREHFDQQVNERLVTREYFERQVHQRLVTREYLDQRLNERLKPVVTHEVFEVRMQTLLTKEEFVRGVSDLRQEMANQRVELLRWSFLFWIGQVAATAGLISLALHSLR